MIRAKVEVEEYCNSCPNFTTETYTQHIWENNDVVGKEVIVSCKYKHHCAHLFKHLNRVSSKEE